MAEPYELSLRESAEEIASGQLAPVELAQSLLGRIDAKENLQAWVTVDREEVLGAASRAEESIARGESLGALHGVPIGLKDIFYTGRHEDHCLLATVRRLRARLRCHRRRQAEGGWGYRAGQGSDH